MKFLLSLFAVKTFKTKYKNLKQSHFNWHEKKPKHFLDRFALCIGVMSLFTKKLNTTHGLRFPSHNGRTRNRATFRELQPILLTWNDYWKTISIDEAQRLNAWIRRAWRTGVASRGSFFRNRLRPPGLLSKTDVKLKQSGSVGLSPCTCVARGTHMAAVYDIYIQTLGDCRRS